MYNSLYENKMKDRFGKNDKVSNVNERKKVRKES